MGHCAVVGAGQRLACDHALPTSKYRADEALRRLSVPSLIVQPSLVYAPHGASTAFFHQLALLPLLVLPDARACVQPVHLDDLVEALVHMVERGLPDGSLTVSAVGPKQLTFRQYLAALRRALGARGQSWVLTLPLPWAQATARLMARLGARFASGDALAMLVRGNTADPQTFASWLDRAPRPAPAFLAAADRQGARERAWLATLLPLLRLSVGAVWIVTGLLSLGLYPVEASLRLLDDFGLQGPWAMAALYAGAAIDLLLGLATLCLPPRWLPWVWRLQLLVMAGHTVLITVRIPHWWLHPFGPVLKNLPLMALTLLLAALHPRR